MSVPHVTTGDHACTKQACCPATKAWAQRLEGFSGTEPLLETQNVVVLHRAPHQARPPQQRKTHSSGQPNKQADQNALKIIKNTLRHDGFTLTRVRLHIHTYTQV